MFEMVAKSDDMGVGYSVFLIRRNHPISGYEEAVLLIGKDY